MNSLLISVSAADRRLLSAFIARRRRPGRVVMAAVTRLGNPTVIVPGMLALLFVSGGTFREGVGVAAWSLALSHLLVQILKRTVTRPRPSLAGGIEALIEPEDRFAFPSGHAAAGLSVALPLFLTLSGPVSFVVLALGLLVGVSRCYLGVHYPFDVLAGWVLAAVTVGLVLAVGS